MDANKTAGEEARQQLHKNAASNIAQVLVATPHKTLTIRAPASHRENYQSNVLLWIHTYGRAKAGRPARTYIQQLCDDTGCSPEDLPEATNDKERWRVRVRDIRACGTTWWWWWWWWCISWRKALLQCYVIRSTFAQQNNFLVTKQNFNLWIEKIIEYVDVNKSIDYLGNVC